MENDQKPISKLEKLKYQRDKIAEKIQAMEQREKAHERKKDARRKILVGAYYLDKARAENKMPELIKELDTYLHRNSDRKLFDLEELPEQK